MKTFNLGQVAYNPRGVYDGTATYNRLDIVAYQTKIYICLTDNTTGVIPTNTTVWMQLNDINGLDTLNANNIHCDSLYSDNIELNGFDLETKLDNIEDKTDYLTVSNNHLSTITFEADYVNATEINADDIFTQGHNVGEDLEDAQNRLNELENKTQYITYADADYTNMRGTLDISGSIEADSAIIDVLATDSIELAGEDLDTTLTGITNKISPLSTGINDNRSYMRIMTDDVEVSNLSVADTTVTDYLEVLGGEMTLGSIVINDENAWFKVEQINAQSQLVVGTHNVANELQTLNEKFVKCTQTQYDTWSALGQIDANKFYFIIEETTTTTSTVSLTKSASVEDEVTEETTEEEEVEEVTDEVKVEDTTEVDDSTEITTEISEER